MNMLMYILLPLTLQGFVRDLPTKLFDLVVGDVGEVGQGGCQLDEEVTGQPSNHFHILFFFKYITLGNIENNHSQILKRSETHFNKIISIHIFSISALQEVRNTWNRRNKFVSLILIDFSPNIHSTDQCTSTTPGLSLRTKCWVCGKISRLVICFLDTTDMPWVDPHRYYKNSSHSLGIRELSFQDFIFTHFWPIHCC